MSTTSTRAAQRPTASGQAITKPKPAIDANPTKSSRRGARVGLTIALVAVGGLGGAYAYTQLSGPTVNVLVLSHEIERGQTISAGDLHQVALPQKTSGIDAVNSTHLDDVVGKRATTTLLSGSILTPKSFAADLTPKQGTSVVGVALNSAQLPSEPLESGDHVRIVDTPVQQGDPPAEAPASVSATVVSTHYDDVASQTIVNVQVGADDAANLAARAATGRVALILDSSEG